MLVGQVTVEVAEARILKLHVHMLGCLLARSWSRWSWRGATPKIRAFFLPCAAPASRPLPLHAECAKPFCMSCHVVMLVGQVTVKVAEARILKLHVHML